MEKVEQKNTKTVEKWNQYLDNLAILISNLRMAYDTDIILGGEVGGVFIRVYDTTGGKSDGI